MSGVCADQVTTWRDFDTREYIPPFAHPRLALEDLRVSHGWVTRELDAAEYGGRRWMILSDERRRLARISYRLKEQG